MEGEKLIGVSRHLDATGCVAYIVSDQDGKIIANKFFDKSGTLLEGTKSGINKDFVKWIIQDKA